MRSSQKSEVTSLKVLMIKNSKLELGYDSIVKGALSKHNKCTSHSLIEKLNCCWLLHFLTANLS